MRLSLVIACFVAIGGLLLATPEAQAGLDACGDIYLAAGANCEVVPPGASCVTQCTPISVEATCAAELQGQCSVECSGSASVECSGSCEASCQAQCEINPGSFDCSTYCTLDCAARHVSPLPAGYGMHEEDKNTAGHQG